jgi:predicted phosphodiesterase
MRIAAIYDIHGNLPALEAVIQDIRDANVDQVVVGGDVIPGPMPRETLTCLLDLDLPVQFIQGNGEGVVLAEMAGADTGTLPEQVREAVRWVAQQLHPEHERLLLGWPKTLRVEIHGLGEVLFCHATPRSDTEVFTRLTPEDGVLPAFAGVSAGVAICGHTHMQFDRMIGRIRVVNAGSVGMPFGEPGAYWVLLGPDVQLRHTPYDLTAAAERIRGTNYPHAREFAAHEVLQPRSETETLELFAGAELKASPNAAAPGSGMGTGNEREGGSGEPLREVADAQHEKAEELREVAEQQREAAEEVRQTEEGLRQFAEGIRTDAEASRLAAEETRVDAEQSRRNAEHVREMAEGVREAAEGVREATIEALDARDDAVAAAAALQDGLADQQRQLDELRATTAAMQRKAETPGPKTGT